MIPAPFCIIASGHEAELDLFYALTYRRMRCILTPEELIRLQELERTLRPWLRTLPAVKLEAWAREYRDNEAVVELIRSID